MCVCACVVYVLCVHMCMHAFLTLLSVSIFILHIFLFPLPFNPIHTLSTLQMKFTVGILSATVLIIFGGIVSVILTYWFLDGDDVN